MKNKTLFFKNLFISPEGKEDNEWFHQATFYLVSNFKKKNLPFVVSDAKFSQDEKRIVDNISNLDSVLKKNSDINLIAITLLEDCFEQIRELCRYLRKKTNAFIVVGGIMPTLNPEHVMAHLPEADIVVRGEGEEVLIKIQNALNGNYADHSDSGKILDKLLNIQGIIFRNKYDLIKSSDYSMNQHTDLDSLYLDFNLIEKKHLKEGLNLSTSRGCRNACFFCTMPEKGRYRAKSFRNLVDILERYNQRLVDLYGKEELIPSSAFNLSFNDDDFLADRERAISFFNYLKTTKFKINFIQAAVNSFFIYKNNQSTNLIDYELIEAIDPSIFVTPSNKNDQRSIYIGTENFCDKELDRLGKGYTYSKIKNLVKVLSAKKISQAHHLIFANRDTSLDNIFENLYKISKLKVRYEKFFHILTPVIPRVVPLYPSAIYKMYLRENEKDCFELKKRLHSDEFPNKDYPLVKSVNPRDSYVRCLSERTEEIFTRSNYYETTLENILILLLMRSERIIMSDKSSKKEINDAKRVRKLIDGNKYYFKNIKNKLDYNNRKKIFINIKSNIQIMLTRKCPLRCSYCPIPKKESDMSDSVCKRAIDLLFTSRKKNLRVDFTGGEPLLRFELLKKAINYSIRLAKANGKKVSFYIVTNAIYLSKEVINFLDKKDVLLEISIDGKEELHNKYKIPLKNINPYKLTVGNAKEIQKRRIKAYVVIVASPATVHYLFESFHHVIELGFKKIEVNYAIGSYWKGDESDEFFKQIKKIIDYYKKQLISKEIEFGNMGKRNEPAVINSEFLIDTDGSIRPLNEFLYKVKKPAQTPYKIKTVFDYEDFDDLYMNDFTVYYSLVKMFGDEDKKIRKILNNNIEMGIKAKKYFKEVNNKFIINKK